MSADIKVTDGTILEALNNKVDIDFDNVASNSVSFARMSREVTNCITEIPQRIKYEIVDGAMCILKDSVAIIPYGLEDLTEQCPKGSTFLGDERFIVYDTQYSEGKFFVWVQCATDIQSVVKTSGVTYERYACLAINGSSGISIPCVTSSGTSDYTATHVEARYLMDKNIVVSYQHSGDTTWEQGFYLSLPLIKGYGVKDASPFVRVDEVFNGMGYIGYYIWLDKGVKGLRANGRNEDGTLNNIEVITEKLQFGYDAINSGSLQPRTMFFYNDNFIARHSCNCFIQNTEPQSLPYPSYAAHWYNPDTNKNYTCLSAENGTPIWELSKYGPAFATTMAKTQVIENVQFRNTIKILGDNNKQEISGWGMPSNKCIDLTLGASVASYTAPANGWFALAKNSTGSGQYVNVGNDTSNFGWQFYTTGNSQCLKFCVPAKKGDVVKVAYNLGGSTVSFRFIYAEGEV